MTAFELIVRAGACTAALILAVALLRARHSGLTTRMFGAALCVGVAVYLACSGSSPVCSQGWFRPLLLLAIAVPFFFWGWAASIMNDDFRLSPVAILACAVLISAGGIGMWTTGRIWDTATVILHSAVGIGFVGAALLTVVRGWRQDLVEARRRMRALILVLCGGYSIAILVVEIFLRGQPPSELLLLINAALLAALLFGLASSILEVSASVNAAFGWTVPATTTAIEPAEVVIRDRERQLVERLHEFMTHDAAYRDPDVAIAPLANRLGVPEKKLRELINRRLGFRNFPSYVNAFRLEEVRRRLAEPAQDGIPILTMALEAGFGSIVAFNRAFKEKFGMTPSTYRSSREASDRVRRE